MMKKINKILLLCGMVIAFLTTGVARASADDTNNGNAYGNTNNSNNGNAYAYGSANQTTYGTDNGNGNDGVNNGNGNNGGNNGNGQNSNQTFLPINGGIAFLLIAGIAGGVFVVTRRRLAQKQK
jgi:hypothetical protein